MTLNRYMYCLCEFGDKAIYWKWGKGGETGDLIIVEWIYNIYSGQWGRGLTKGNIKELCPIIMDGVT